MALLFVAGVMSIWWVATLSAFVLAEKMFPNGLLLGKATMKFRFWRWKSV